MDLQYLTIIVILILILQLFIAYTVYNLNNKRCHEKFDNGCRPGQLKNFGICMNPQN